MQKTTPMRSVIIFNGVVYDNAFPKGANYEEWKNNFWAPSGELKITPTDF